MRDTVESVCFFSSDRGKKDRPGGARGGGGQSDLLPKRQFAPPQKDNLAKLGMRATSSDQILLGGAGGGWTKFNFARRRDLFQAARQPSRQSALFFFLREVLIWLQDADTCPVRR